MKFNYHGAVGIFSFLLMCGIAFFQHGKINWWYVGVALAWYFVTVCILLIKREGNVYLLGCHYALLFLAVGLLLKPSVISAGFVLNPEEINVSSVLKSEYLRITVAVLIANASSGYVIPYLGKKQWIVPSGIAESTQRVTLLHPRGAIMLEKTKQWLTFDSVAWPYGIIGIPLLLILYVIVVFHHWDINFWYFALMLAYYSIANVRLILSLLSRKFRTSLRLQFGNHLTLVFLTVGLLFNLQNWTIIAIFFASSILVGLTIPFLLVRNT